MLYTGVMGALSSLDELFRNAPVSSTPLRSWSAVTLFFITTNEGIGQARAYFKGVLVRPGPHLCAVLIRTHLYQCVFVHDGLPYSMPILYLNEVDDLDFMAKSISIEVNTSISGNCVAQLPELLQSMRASLEGADQLSWKFASLTWDS